MQRPYQRKQLGAETASRLRTQRKEAKLAYIELNIQAPSLSFFPREELRRTGRLVVLVLRHSFSGGGSGLTRKVHWRFFTLPLRSERR